MSEHLTNYLTSPVAGAVPARHDSIYNAGSQSVFKLTLRVCNWCAEQTIQCVFCSLDNYTQCSSAEFALQSHPLTSIAPDCAPQVKRLRYLRHSIIARNSTAA